MRSLPCFHWSFSKTSVVGAVQIWKSHVLSLFLLDSAYLYQDGRVFTSIIKKDWAYLKFTTVFILPPLGVWGVASFITGIKSSYPSISADCLKWRKNPPFSLVLSRKFESSFLLVGFSPYDKPSYYFQSKILVIIISIVHICLKYWFIKHFGEYWMWKI